jgi:hypothetical protein
MAITDENITRRIRNLIPDTDAIFGDAKDEFIFSDQAIEDFYLDGNSSVKWAAGLARITLGSSEALISKKIKNYETSTDGPAVGKELRMSGQALIEEAKVELAAGELDYFDTVYFAEAPLHPEAAPYTVGRWNPWA